MSKILTDNGKAFTDRFSPSGDRVPTGNHRFDQACQKHAIEHRLIQPRRPQTNGMVARFNGRIAQTTQNQRFQFSGRICQGFAPLYSPLSLSHSTTGFESSNAHAGMTSVV
ncbi:MAG TPA: transposase [Sulfurivirga caldicuralii]|nr:transposase [Sulfurivirga caldicuralii]